MFIIENLIFRRHTGENLKEKCAPDVFVVYQCSIINVMVSGDIEALCIARFTLLMDVRNTPAASSNLSNYYPGLNYGRFTHIMASHI